MITHICLPDKEWLVRFFPDLRLKLHLQGITCTTNGYTVLYLKDNKLLSDVDNKKMMQNILLQAVVSKITCK